jgi:hypothetical protein
MLHLLCPADEVHQKTALPVSGSSPGKACVHSINHVVG